MARRTLPGFRLSLSFALIYLALLVVIPLLACFIKAFSLSPSEFVAAAWTDRTKPRTYSRSGRRWPQPR